MSLAGCKTDDEPQWEAEVVKPEDQPQDKPEDKPEDTADFRAIRLNELDGNKPKFIELYNTSAQAVDITGMTLRKNGDEMVYGHLLVRRLRQEVSSCCCPTKLTMLWDSRLVCMPRSRL